MLFSQCDLPDFRLVSVLRRALCDQSQKLSSFKQGGVTVQRQAPWRLVVHPPAFSDSCVPILHVPPSDHGFPHRNFEDT